MKETKTVQVYPSDAIVNETIAEYECFGWEVIGNQRCQEFDGTTHGIDGSTTQNYSTFNKLTFTREKESRWYEDVTTLENVYYNTKSTIKSYQSCAPVLRKPKPTGAIAVLLGIYLYMFFLIPGIIYSIVRAAKKSKYKKEYAKELAEYNSVYPEKIRELEKRLAEVRVNASKCISGKA